MISLALIGLSDPRHRWFTSAVERTRPGIRVVGVSEPDDQTRGEFAALTSVPAFPGHQQLLTETRPTDVAISCHSEEAAIMARDALETGARVFFAPPLLGSAADGIAEYGSTRLIPVHTYRGHAAAKLARGLADRGKLGEISELRLALSDSLGDAESASAIAEATDLAGFLTGDDESVGTPAVEVRRLPTATAGTIGIQLVTSRGTVQWDVRSGTFRTTLDDLEPTTVDCEPPRHIAQWVLEHYLLSR